MKASSRLPKSVRRTSKGAKRQTPQTKAKTAPERWLCRWLAFRMGTALLFASRVCTAQSAGCPVTTGAEQFVLLEEDANRYIVEAINGGALVNGTTGT